jgi:DNA-binding NarL/FixJ family response regulator
MAPTVQILLVGKAEDETEFLQYVRATIRGYLPQDASPENVLDAMRAAHAGEAVCPGQLCALLFRSFWARGNAGTFGSHPSEGNIFAYILPSF